MFRKPSLSFLPLAFAFIVCNYAYAVTYVDNGTSNSYTLNAGDSLYIASGTYTGNIGGFASGAKITVSDMAIFQPTGMAHPNVHGTMYVYGTFIMNNANFRTNTDFTIYNYGTVQINNQTTINGSNQLWFNSYGANMYFVGDVIMNGDTGVNNVMINYELIQCSASFQMNSGSAFTNYKEFSAAGNFRVNGGNYSNWGNLRVTGNITQNNGASVIRNYCRMEASGGIINTSGNFYNHSYLWAKNDLGLGTITNSANIYNSSVNLSVPMIHGRNLTHTGGTITGKGYLYFYGTTSTSGAATTGVTGITTDTLKFYDITRASPTTVYDIQTGTVYPNTIYNAWGTPDSTRDYLLGCSFELFMEIPLAINWSYFTVSLSENIPVLNWAAEYSSGTVFEVERSYNGRDFNKIGELLYKTSQSRYAFADREVNRYYSYAFYRIKAIEENGMTKYTPVRMVRFSNTKNILVFPNPFKKELTIKYKATAESSIGMMLYSSTGQLLLKKNIQVSRGENIIQINEAAQLSPGVYVLRISGGAESVSTIKLVKQ